MFFYEKNKEYALWGKGEFDSEQVEMGTDFGDLTVLEQSWAEKTEEGVRITVELSNGEVWVREWGSVEKEQK